MTSSNTVHRSFSNNAIEPHLLQIESQLRAESIVEKQKLKKDLECITSIGLSFIFIGSAAFSGKCISQLLRGKLSELADKVDLAAGAAAGILGSWFCASQVIRYPKDINDIREGIFRDVAYKKLIFFDDFDRETNQLIAEISELCPITGGYPRFPVRDLRVLGNGQRIRQTYEWAGLQYILEKPIEARKVPSLKYARIEDFEFCEDQCSRIHHLLYSRNKIRSENPIEALFFDLSNLGFINSKEGEV